MKSNSRVLRGWRDFGVKATAIILTILLATQMVGTPAFASGALTNKQASEDIATTVDDTGVEPSGTEATDTTVPDEAAGAANEPAPADSAQATEESTVDGTEPAADPEPETEAAEPAANAVLGDGSDSSSEPAPAADQDQPASITLDLAEGTSITYNETTIEDDTNPIEVPANQELKFTAQAAEGWQVDAVKTVVDGVETELAADANGEYKVAADKVTDAPTVKVEAAEAAEATENEAEEFSATDGESAAAGDAVAQSAPATSNGISLQANGLVGSGEENDRYIVNPGESVTVKTTYKRDYSWGDLEAPGSVLDWQSWNVDGAKVSDKNNGNSRDQASVRFTADSDVAAGSEYRIWYGENQWKWEPDGSYIYFQIGQSNSLSVELENSSIEVGSRTKATASDKNGVIENVTWSSSSNQVATVDGSGRVTGVSEGSASIIAKDDEGRTASAKITVTAQMATVTFGLNDESGNRAQWTNNPSGNYKVGAELWGENETFAKFGYPSRNGYVFAGWDKSVNRIVTGDVTYTAQWEKVPSGKTAVYVCTKVTGDGDTSDLVQNKDGWYTIGIIYLDSRLLQQTTQMYDSEISQWVTAVELNDNVRQAIDEAFEGIDRYQDNRSIDIDDLNLRILKIAGGASDYIDGGNQWHLDCTIDIQSLVGYTVEYRDIDTNEKIANDEEEIASNGAWVSADDHKISIKNYTYIYSDPQNGMNVSKGEKNVLVLYYSRRDDALTYHSNDGNSNTYVSPGDAGTEIEVISVDDA